MTVNMRKVLLGDYNYGYLCTPVWPFRNVPRAPPQFFGPEAPLGLVVAAIMGLQHTLAMVGGLITPPLLVGALAEEKAVKQYLVQAALIVCSVMTAVQVTGIRFGSWKRQLGAGLLSMMGTSFASVPIVTFVIQDIMARGADFKEAYGQVLGTLVLCSLTPALLSLLPQQTLRKMFPPVVSGVTIILMGVSLTGTGMKNWAGGAFCGDNTQHYPDPLPAALCRVWDEAQQAFVPRSCFDAENIPLCTGNGDVKLLFGSPVYVSMGSVVFTTIMAVELFGSPFMRNCAVAMGLVVGYAVAAVTTDGGKSLIVWDSVHDAPAVSFLWSEWFPLGFYPPAVFPLVIVYCLTSVECVGDVTATEEASGLPTDGPQHVRHIRGALLNDGLSGIVSALAFSMPLTTFAQNNGVISLTSVAARSAGYSAAVWLLILGVCGKFCALLLTIPDCVLGGMTTFLFANVVTSGFKIIMSQGYMTRRNRFIMAASLALGLGATLVPQWASNALWPDSAALTPGMRGVRSAILLVLQTGFCIGAIVAFLLNLIMPKETSMTADITNTELLGSSRVLDMLLDPASTAQDSFAARGINVYCNEVNGGVRSLSSMQAPDMELLRPFLQDMHADSAASPAPSTDVHQRDADGVSFTTAESQGKV